MIDRYAVLVERLRFLGQASSTETVLFHQRVAERVGLGITDVKAISVLVQEGSMTAGRLAQRLGVTSGAVTSLLGRLEQRGVVGRSRDRHDRRKVIIQVKHDVLAQ